MNKLDLIIRDQQDFQRLLGIPVDSFAEVDVLQMAELHCFKTFEEIAELRKTFPSTLNKYEKNKPVIDRKRIRQEMCDIFLYMINFGSVWKMTPDELLEELQEVQTNNFIKAKEKIMGELNSQILMVAGEPAGVGSGSLMPKYIFVGQNPAEGIEKRYKFFSDRNDGSSKILIPVLEELGILNQCYFTNLVKSVTPKNVKPSVTSVEFWMEFFRHEIDILRRGCQDAKVIPMGKFASIHLNKKGIPHPAAVQYGSVTEEQFKNEIIINL